MNNLSWSFILGCMLYHPLGCILYHFIYFVCTYRIHSRHLPLINIKSGQISVGVTPANLHKVADCLMKITDVRCD